jgi:hypothetical protein
MLEQFFFAWCDDVDPWGVEFQREDEEIFELEIAEAEGDFPSLQLDVKNPKVGLLGPGRKQWCWLAWDDGSVVHPMFHGRLVGIPENLQDEIVRLMFIARPSEYPAQKAALAETLRVLPFYDPIWFDQQEVDDDAVLETRMLNFQVDRLTLVTTVSDMLAGEDGVIEVGPDDHLYSRMEVGFEETPKRRVHVTGTVSWVQRATGVVDLTARVVSAFQQAGSVFPWPMVGSYTANGLLASWPQPETSFGGGWKMATGSSAVRAAFTTPSLYAVRYTDKRDSTSILGVEKRDNFGNMMPGQRAREFFIGWRNYDVTFAQEALNLNFLVAHEAARNRSEVVTFTMTSDIQSIQTDPGADEDETIDLSSDLVDQPIDPGEALPIGDLRRNAYFTTDRGQQSLQFLVLLAASKLLVSARAVRITFATPWRIIAPLVNCRKSVHLLDPRLPGGEATGKIVSLRLTASGTGANLAEVTIGCSVGYGIALPAAAAGEDDYADDYADDWTETVGGQTAVIPGQLVYESLDGAVVIDDDGVDLFNLTPETIVEALTITGGPNDQLFAIGDSLAVHPDDTTVKTTGDILGTAVTNLSNVEGLLTGVTYDIGGIGTSRRTGVVAGGPGGVIGARYGVGGELTTFTFDGSAGGTLSRPLVGFDTGITGPASAKGAVLTISAQGGAVFTPDPISALGGTPTIVTLKLVPVAGGDFKTPIEVTVANLVIPKTIDLEAA